MVLVVALVTVVLFGKHRVDVLNECVTASEQLTAVTATVLEAQVVSPSVGEAAAEAALPKVDRLQEVVAQCG